MARGSWRQVDRGQWLGRLQNARDFLQAARNAAALAEASANGNPIMSQVVLAVIAYGDALTIRFGGIQNEHDHRQLVRALRYTLGNAADAEQLTRLGRIIGRKDQIQYDHRTASLDEARGLLEQAERFAVWAERELLRA
ncbi:hypothetical protein BH23GEM7_BH23GEM7_39500 [soil metagenome]